ncbi:cytochrome P450 [Mycena vulgaris]|nr:cytochrome P450 [Mycena vulgaris]
MDHILAKGIYAVLAILVLYSVGNASLGSKQIESVPATSSGGLISSYRDAFRFLLHGEHIVQQGYKLYKGLIFRVPLLGRWNFVVGGADLIKDMAHTPEDTLSFQDAIREQIQSDFTMGPELRENEHIIPGALFTLTRNLGRCFPDVRDEIVCAFDEVLGLKEEAMTDIIARVSNRLFVGLPLCRDPEYLKFSVNHTMRVFMSGRMISVLTPVLRPILAPLLCSRKRDIRQAKGFMGELVAQRLGMFEEYGKDWQGKPNDLISWIIDLAEPGERYVPWIVQRVLVIIMAAIHTSPLTFVQVLLDLASHPSYMQPLREEVESVVGKQGWTKSALGDMPKIDSFLRESQRLNGIATRALRCSMYFQFSDGTVLPQGSFVNVAVRAVHLDPDLFTNPEDFDGFRFFKMRSEDESGIFKHHMVTTELTHLAFGHGNHACPGRFFAATELKGMLAHLVLNYDVKLDGPRPPDLSFAAVRSPNRKAKVLFRKRQC